MTLKRNFNETIFIELLKFGSEKGLEGCNFIQIVNWAIGRKFVRNPELASFLETPRSMQISISELTSGKHWDYKVQMLWSLFKECYQLTLGGQPEEAGQNCILKVEYYFRLVEYKELQEARNSSRIALITAVIAIVISGASLLHSFYPNPIEINAKQIQELRRSMPIYDSCINKNKRIRIDTT